MELRIEISAEEWRLARRLTRFSDDDERGEFGMLRLTAEDGRRQWWASDGLNVATEPGGEDERTYDLLVSPRLVTFALAEGEDPAALIATYEDDVLQRVAVTRGAATLTVAADHRTFPPFHELVESIAADVSLGTSATVDGSELASVAHNASLRALPSEDEHDDDGPLLWLTVEDGNVQLAMNWPDLGFTRFEVAGDGFGSAAIPVPPALVAAATDWLSGRVTVAIPDYGPMLLTDGERKVLLFPVDPAAPARKRVESLLREVFGPSALEQDDDGDYPLAVRSTSVYARFVAGDPSTLQVFAIVLAGVEPSADLLSELNDQNSRLEFVRTFLDEDRILVKCDLVADRLDAVELNAAVEACRESAEELGPVISALFGGRPPGPDADERWAKYGATVIEAELTPGAFVTVNGPDAVAPWPLDGPAWVVTAANPYGRRRPDERNEAENSRLAADIFGAGGACVRAVGSDPESDYSEASLLCWELDRDTVRAMGRAYGQEAVFEIDGDEVRVVACFDDRVDVTVRQA